MGPNWRGSLRRCPFMLRTSITVARPINNITSSPSGARAHAPGVHLSQHSITEGHAATLMEVGAPSLLPAARVRAVVRVCERDVAAQDDLQVRRSEACDQGAKWCGVPERDPAQGSWAESRRGGEPPESEMATVTDCDGRTATSS